MQAPRSGLVKDEHGNKRCWWGASTPDYAVYHDEEWGWPTEDDHQLFEKICLEGFQSGLSWLTILRKRESFRRAFCQFNIEKVARFNQRSVSRLLKDEGIIRHRGKIESTINNAKRALELRAEYGTLAAYFWSFEPQAKERPKRCTWGALKKITKTESSVAMSKDLKKRGWSFVGPTTAYAFMQAMGLVNDHVEGCSARAGCTQARAEFQRPAPSF